MSIDAVLIHTLHPLVQPFQDLSRQILPQFHLLHVLDEPLLERIRAHDGPDSRDVDRLRQHLLFAQEIGARAALITCSTLSTLVGEASASVPISVLAIDDALLTAALKAGRRIGIVATNPTTLSPTMASLADCARREGTDIETECVLVPNALSLLLAGDGEAHDRLVREATLKLAREVDVVVLAQASMARVLEKISDAEKVVPILSSPHMALAKLREELERCPAPGG